MLNNLPNIALAQIYIVPGRPDLNFEKIKSYINEYRNKVDIIVFPEMSLSGYMIGDDWDDEYFVNDCMAYNEKIKNITNGLVVIWGNVDIDETKKGEDGRVRKYNSAFIAQNCKWVSNGIFFGKTYKTNMPKYREFDDERYFYSLNKLSYDLALEKLEKENKIITNNPLYDLLKPFKVNIKGASFDLGIMLCEDMWDEDYTQKPSKILALNGAQFLINISCSPWSLGKNKKRHLVVGAKIKETGLPVYYVNNVGIQNNGKNIFLFDGGTTIYNNNGEIISSSLPYLEGVIFSGVKNIKTQFSDEEDIYNGLIFGIKNFFKNIGTKKVVIGLSGGIDSAVVSVLMVHALGKENVFLINMPSIYNTNTTKNSALRLAKNLDAYYSVIPIQDSIEYNVKQLESAVFKNSSNNDLKISLSKLNKENIQARDRGSRILSGISSSLGAVFTNNGNKTETALGYATLYGDICGAIAPIADLYKTQVYKLADYINNTHNNIIPEEIMKLKPSAELSEDQNPEDGKGDPIIYDYHDKLLYQFIEGGYQNDEIKYGRRNPESILKWYIEGTLEERIGLEKGKLEAYFKDDKDFIDDLEHKWKLYKNSFFKRIQSPPIVVISKRSFGFDLRESQNSAFFTKNYNSLKKSLL